MKFHALLSVYCQEAGREGEIGEEERERKRQLVPAAVIINPFSLPTFLLSRQASLTLIP
jgi:hypothetical protein